jgi:hypothetical protein
MVVATKVTQNRRRSETSNFKPLTVGAGSSLRFFWKKACRELELVPTDELICIAAEGLAELQELQQFAGDNVENVSPRQGGKGRRFANADLLEFLNQPMVFADFQSLAKGGNGAGLVSGEEMDASQVQVVGGILRIERDRFFAQRYPFFVLAGIFGKAEATQREHVRGFAAEALLIIYFVNGHLLLFHSLYFAAEYF